MADRDVTFLKKLVGSDRERDLLPEPKINTSSKSFLSSLNTRLPISNLEILRRSELFITEPREILASNFLSSFEKISSEPANLPIVPIRDLTSSVKSLESSILPLLLDLPDGRAIVEEFLKRFNSSPLELPLPPNPVFVRDALTIDEIRIRAGMNSMRGFVVLDEIPSGSITRYELAAAQAFGVSSSASSENLARRADLGRERLRPRPLVDDALADLLDKGFVAAHPIAPNPEARRQRRAMLMDVPEYQALMKLISGNTDFQRDVGYFVHRTFEMRRTRKDPESNVLGMGYDVQRQACHTTPLVVGMLRSPRLSLLFQRAIDRTVDSDTREFTRRIKNSEVGILPELYIGTGAAVSNYTTTRYMLIPSRMGVAADRRPTIGGEFALSNNKIWTVNSETNPVREDRRNSPGGAGTLNGLGPCAPVQQADLTHEGYGGQNSIGNAVRANVAQTVLALSNFDFIAAYRNDTDARAIIPATVQRQFPPGTAIAEFRHPETYERVFVATERIISGSGFGTPQEGLDTSDPKTRAILLREYAKAARGEKSRIYTLDEIVSLLGDTAKAMPLRGIREIVQLGGAEIRSA